MLSSKFDRSTIISFFVNNFVLNSYDLQEFGVLIRIFRTFIIIFFLNFSDWNTLR